MLRSIALVLVVLVAAACTPPALKPQAGYQTGQYAIKQLVVRPATPQLAMDAEYIEAEKLIREGFRWDTLGEGRTPEALLTITVQGVSLDINTIKTLLLADAYAINAKIELTDLATGKLIAEENVSTQSGSQMGLGGVIASGIYNQTEESERLIRQFNHRVISLLYPKEIPNK